jgi:hypothetical protein
MTARDEKIWLRRPHSPSVLNSSGGKTSVGEAREGTSVPRRVFGDVVEDVEPGEQRGHATSVQEAAAGELLLVADGLVPVDEHLAETQ